MTLPAPLLKAKNDLNKRLHEENNVTKLLGKLEEKTSVDRLYVVLGLLAIFGLYLIFGDFAELICNGVGFGYPAYLSIKAIESRSTSDDTQLLIYWTVFALFNLLEFFSEVILSYFPLYWLGKCVLVVYLYLPETRGAEKFYLKFIQPLAQRYSDRWEKKVGDAANKVTDGVKDAAEHLKGN